VIVEASQRLIAAADELDSISKALVQLENVIEELEPRYEDAIEAFIAELWDESVRDEKKFPPKDVRDAMAFKAMDADLRLSYRMTIRRRQKTKQRLTDLREIVAAQRSIVSAAKTEMEATAGPQPAWSNS
jgi:predicted  nucleic acid-binding Zn-ribbon protein